MGIRYIWSSLKITNKIMLGLLLSVIPMLLIVIISYVNTSSSYRNNSSRVIEMLLANQATEINKSIKQQGAVFDNWTNEDVYGMSIEFETLEELKDAFKSMLEQAPSIGMLILANKEGKILISAFSEKLSQQKSLDFAGQTIPDFGGFATDKKSVRITGNHFLSQFGQPFPKTFEYVFPTKNTSAEHNGFLIAVMDWSSLHQNNMMRFNKLFRDLGYENANSILFEIGNTNNICHSDQNMIGKPLEMSDELKEWVSGNNENKIESFQYAGLDSFYIYQPIVDNESVFSNTLNLEGSSLFLSVIVPEKDVLGRVQNLLLISVVITIIGVLAVFLASFFTGRQISRPMGKAVNMMHELGSGEFGSRLEVIGKDEIAEMSKAMNDFAEVLQMAISNINSVLQGLANGDLHQQVDVSLEGELQTLKEGVNNTVDILSKMLEDVAATSTKIDSSSEELAGSSQSLADGTSQQAASLQEISSTVNEIESQSKTNSDNASQAQQITKQTLEIVKKGNQQMQSMLASMKSIEENSANVAKINKVIDEIAFQTNLLALNAAVEAARAGKYGKGFAVVAEEVRNLASRSADAAKNTTELIETSVKEIAIGVQGADETAAVLSEVNSGVEKVADLVDEIAVASNQQAGAVGEINKGLTQVNHIVQQNSSISEQTSAASNILSSQVKDLQEMMRRFNIVSAKSHSDENKLKKKPVKQLGLDSQKSFQPPLPAPENIPDVSPNPDEKRQKQIILDDDDFGKY